MRYVFVLFASLLLLAACEMPGVDEIRTEVNESIDDLSDEIEGLDLDSRGIESRLEFLEQEIAGFTGEFTGEFPDIEIPDLSGVINEITAQTDSLETANVEMSLVMEEMTLTLEDMQLSLEEMTVANDSLVLKIDDLEGSISSLQWQINQIDARESSGSSGGSSGSRGSTSSSGTSGSSSGGTSGSR